MSKEHRRTFNLGNFESVQISDFEREEIAPFLNTQVRIINNALELLNFRKVSAVSSFENDLAVFCKRQISQLNLEKEQILKKIKEKQG